MLHPDDSDGDWEVANPTDPTTGLWYKEDWQELLETYIKHGFNTALMSKPEDHPFMLVERSYNPPPIRQQSLELLMEELNVPAAFLARDATLACYACGRTSGTVVDIGYNGTVVTPVYEGYVEQKGIRRSPMGARAMDEAVTKVLDTLHKKPFLPLYRVKKFSERPDPIHRLARLEVARHCRDLGAGAAVVTTHLESGFQAPHVTFELPDGQTVDVPSKHRFAVVDQLVGKEEESSTIREEKLGSLQKELASVVKEASEEDEDEEEKEYYKQLYSESAAVGLLKRRDESKKKKRRTKDTKQPAQDTKPPFSNRHMQRACATYLQSQQEFLTASPIPGMVCDAAFRCDRDQQASLLGNVVLAGGGACLGPTDQALPDYLREEIEAIIHQHTPGWRVKVLSPNFPERSVASWLGGSILGSLGSFHDMWITKKEYDEWGAAIVNRKCP